MAKDFGSLPYGKVVSRNRGKQFPLHAMTILSGHCLERSSDYYNNGTTIKGGGHVAWQYTISGRGQLEHEDKVFPLSPGSLMVITLPGPYTYYLPKDSAHWEFVFLTMIGREVISIARAVERRWGPVLSADNLPGTLSCLYSVLDALISGRIDNPFENSRQTYQFCMRFLEEQAHTKAEEETTPLVAIDEFLKDNIHRDISVSEMADRMRLSRSYFTKVFTKGMGISPRLYLEDLRLKTARCLLLDKDMTVKETAIQCGIPDVNYFCRLFKKRFGISPGRFRTKELTIPDGGAV